MKKIHIYAKRLGTIAHYIGVICEYVVIILLGIWLNNLLKLPSITNISLMIVGILIIILGIFLIAWSSWLQFKIGKGTTGFSEPTKELVTYGPYGIVRNPMMEGQFLFFIGIGLLLDLVAMFLILPILILAIHLFTVFIEEPNLKKRFGEKYMNYCEKVPRWFPRLRRTQKDIRDLHPSHS